MKHSPGQAFDAAFSELPPRVLFTAAEVGEWLKVSRRQVQRLGVPWIDLGRKTRRYQLEDFLAWLETRRRESGP